MSDIGFGPDVSASGFPLDVYRARRAVTWIAQKENIDPTMAGFASQVIVNQWEGKPVEFAIPADQLDEAVALAERAVRQAAEDKIVGKVSAYTTMMGVQPYTEEEREMQRAQERFYASGYNPLTGTGGQQLQRDQLEADPSAARTWTKNSDTPGIDATVSEQYDQIEFLKKRKKEKEDAAVAALDLNTASKGEIYDAREAAGRDDQARIDVLYKSIANYQKQQTPKIGNLQGQTQQQIADVLREGNERPMGSKNPQEVSQSFAQSVMWQATQLAGKPEYPGDNATPAQWRTYNKARAAYEKQQEDYIANSLSKAPVSDVVRDRRGPVSYTENQAHELWWHFQNDRAIPAERARLEQLERQQDMYNAASEAQLKTAKQRIIGGDVMLQKYLDTPKGEARTALRDEDWRYSVVLLAAYNTDVYDQLVKQFGKDAVFEYYQSSGKQPEWPGDNASEEELQAYYKVKNEYDATYPNRNEVSLWLNGRYSWADENSSSNPGNYDRGADYEDATAIFGDRIFEIEREFNAASLNGTWKEWRNAHQGDYEKLIGYGEWKKAAQNEPQNTAQLPSARWGVNPATANASYASESDRTIPPGARSQPGSVADVLRRPYEAGQEPSRLARVGREATLRGQGQMAGVNPPAEPSLGGGNLTAEDWALENKKFADYQTGGGGQWGPHYDALDALGDDFNAKRQYMLDHPEFAEYEAARILRKYGDNVPWWLEDYSKRYGSSKRFGKGSYGRDGGSGSEWSLNWDEYQGLGEDWDAKKQYMLDNPAFAKYYKDKYGNAWWEDDGTGTVLRRAFVPWVGGGGGGGGSPWLGGGGGGGGGYAPRVDPRYMDRSLWDAPEYRPWIPYSDPTPEWLRAGDRLAPEPIRKWQRPRY
jgi:hypothetical protein